MKDIKAIPNSLVQEDSLLSQKIHICWVESLN